MSEQHIAAVKTLLGSSTYQAVCLCGWKGPKRETATTAEEDGTKHEKRRYGYER